MCTLPETSTYEILKIPPWAYVVYCKIYERYDPKIRDKKKTPSRKKQNQDWEE